MFRASVPLWSWVLLAAMMAAAVCPRWPGACGCVGEPADEVSVATGPEVASGDACCGHQAVGPADAHSPDEPARPCDEHGCSCELACCGVARPLLIAPAIAVPGLVPIKSAACEMEPVMACPAPGFAGDLFRPPRA